MLQWPRRQTRPLIGGFNSFASMSALDDRGLRSTGRAVRTSGALCRLKLARRNAKHRDRCPVSPPYGLARVASQAFEIWRAAKQARCGLRRTPVSRWRRAARFEGVSAGWAMGHAMMRQPLSHRRCIMPSASTPVSRCRSGNGVNPRLQACCEMTTARFGPPREPPHHHLRHEAPAAPVSRHVMST